MAAGCPKKMTKEAAEAMAKGGRTTTTRPRGPTDPERHVRIARAALEVIARRGIAGLTHRAVAEQAEVPLGSTTYHYADRDALLLAAIEEAVDGYRRKIVHWSQNLTSRSIIQRLAGLLEALTATRALRDRLRVEYDLYLAAARSKQLRAVSIEWDAILPQAMKSAVSEGRARSLYIAVNGLLIESLIYDKPLTNADMTAVLSMIKIR
jgi:DNA-binding transcriptional regulator YbjK